MRDPRPATRTDGTGALPRLLLSLRERFARTAIPRRVLLALAIAVAAAFLLHRSTLALVLLLVFGVFALFLLARRVGQRALWTVRNRLIATYLLMGLAPVVLFVLLAGIAAYLFSGQFATNTALAALDAELLPLKERAVALSGVVAHETLVHPGAKEVDVPDFNDGPRNPIAANGALRYAAWLDGAPLQLRGAPPTVQTGLPAWVEPGFNGVVEENGRLYLRVADGFSFGPDKVPVHALRVTVSVLLDRNRLGAVARGLGVVKLLHGSALRTDEREIEGKTRGMADPDPRRSPFAPVSGGILPVTPYPVDPPILFLAPMPCVDWQTGARIPAQVGVISRAGLLYSRLFATSVRIGALVRSALLAIAVVFAMLEALALYLAVRLSRTITRSVADLYRATMEIDRGHFEHRIPVRRRDQLGALSASFNKMSASLVDLLDQQQQKQRLENELSIAQEVQNNLFPASPVRLPRFELHGICKPARTVSGDYYDFLQAGAGEICFAVGDISGKGISAALLMASLHAAVRAFCSGDQDFKQGGGSPFRLTSPARLLTLLNRHLLASTQPEKYATLFLACYSSATAELCYANGGQPPPLLLRAGGQVERLDRGGSVVGLLGGMRYEEATVTLTPGDLVMIYSDGVTEPENAFGEFGEQRLLDLVRAHRHEPLASISGAVMRALHAWIGEVEQPDDITLVLARKL